MKTHTHNELARMRAKSSNAAEKVDKSRPMLSVFGRLLANRGFVATRPLHFGTPLKSSASGIRSAAATRAALRTVGLRTPRSMPLTCVRSRSAFSASCPGTGQQPRASGGHFFQIGQEPGDGWTYPHFTRMWSFNPRTMSHIV